MFDVKMLINKGLLKIRQYLKSHINDSFINYFIKLISYYRVLLKKYSTSILSVIYNQKNNLSQCRSFVILELEKRKIGFYFFIRGVANGINYHYSIMDMSMDTKFIMVTKPYLKRVEGFLLDSLLVDIRSGKYYYDLEVKDISTSTDDGVRKFFMKILSER